MNVKEICLGVKRSVNLFAKATEDDKNGILRLFAEDIKAHKKEILAENAKDTALAAENGKSATFIDRLTLNDARIEGMCGGIDAVTALPDPVGAVDERYTLSNGLNVEKVRAPLGVIGIIYEARPNVTVDAAILCIKSSNGVVLRGSKDALNSNRYLAFLMKNALEKCGFDRSLIGFIDGADRELTKEMLKQEGLIDVIIPRGGEELKKFVLSNALMPVIASAGGNCHTYVEKSADKDMALNIILNAKLSRPSVCNALETILCDREIAAEFLPVCLDALKKSGVEIRGTEEVKKIYPQVAVVDENEFFTEYENLTIKVKVVSGIDEAAAHINFYGTNHSDAVITSDAKIADRFSREVDSAAVYINASTRFTDGFELGLGAEMGISTQKLHVRGPIGLKELTSLKYVVRGNGQIRV